MTIQKNIITALLILLTFVKLEALDKKTIPDIIPLDIELENKYDGIEIGEFIFKNYNFPIIYITARSDTKMVKKDFFSQNFPKIKAIFTFIFIINN